MTTAVQLQGWISSMRRIAASAALALALTLLRAVVAAPTAQAQTCPTAPGGLVSCWPADGNSKDIIGTNDGVLQDGVNFTHGLAGQAFGFDGLTAFVDVPDSESFDAIRTGISVDLWLKPEAPFIAYPWIFSRRDPFISDSFSVYMNAGGAVALALVTTDSGGADFGSFDGLLQFGQWNHLVASYDSASGVVSVFHNGQHAVLHQIDGPPVVTGPLVNVDHLFLGRRQTSDGNEGAEGGGYYRGLLDEVKVYRRALTPREIRILFLAFLSQSVQGIVQHVIRSRLNPKLEAGLLGELDVAMDSLQNPDVNTSLQAASALEFLVKTVTARRRTEIAPDEADALILEAGALIVPLTN